MESGINGSQGRCANEVVVLKSKCIFNLNGHCIVGLKCSYLDLNGTVHYCAYHPNPLGRFALKKHVSIGINPAVLTPSKYVRGHDY